ncbi:peroxiredoxin [Dysgonomonadaceae bacterium PH5-43]|nr:peroxiredoxin [Dysgonomonadaceae bacterium PH5-43]
MKKIICFSLFILLLTNSFGQDKITCRLLGKTIDRPKNETLLLSIQDSDLRVVEAIRIPVVNNSFEYELICEEEEMYALTFEQEILDGSWTPIFFMSENGTVNFELYPKDFAFSNNVIKGTGRLNKEYSLFEENCEKLFRLKALSRQQELLPNEGLTPQAHAIYKRKSEIEKQYENDWDNEEFLQKMNDLRNDMASLNGNYYTDECISLQNELMQSHNNRIKWQADYLIENNSVFGLCQTFYLLKAFKSARERNDLSFSDKEDKLIETFNNVYKQKYPNHSITKRISQLISSKDIKEGNKFIDFSCVGFDGNDYTLSKEIANKVALLDLWASWCGPCRRKSKEMIAVYNDFKDKGFTVVGVARERRKEDGENAIKRDGYTWLNLLELNDKNEIWHKYGVGNSGGATFLIDTDGTILKVNPSADEVREILNEKTK